MHRFDILLLSTLALGAHATSHPSLPIVDLGYQVHRAISYNDTIKAYNFTNIPYAEPPVGSLRWRAPIPPKGVKKTIQDGSIGKICPQTSPNWTITAIQFATAWATNQLSSFNYTEAEKIANSTPQTTDPRTTEDCLVLDVIVPKAVLDKKKSHGKKAPVLVWIYGGGYVSGSKESWGSPNRIISASQEDGSDGIIWVAMNYRLGAFGFLAGPTMQKDGTANAGLYDQRLALQWVQENIAKFGGDPDNVTVMGESAGAGSIMFHLLAQGGKQPQESSFQKFLKILNVKSLKEARRLPSSALIAANVQQIGAEPYNEFAFSPSVDNVYIPGPPAKLLLEGAFAKGIPLLSSHTSFEGTLFTDPRTIGNETALANRLQTIYPLMEEKDLNYVLNTLYPAVYDGSHPYATSVDRNILMANEMYFATAHQALLQTTIHRGTEVHAWEFSVPPAIHGSDIAYTFYDGAAGVDPHVASIMQHAIAGFAKCGEPDAGPLGFAFPRYGKQATTVNLNINSSVTVSDPTWNNRTLWLAQTSWIG
ncbi:carboxylesterase family domain-containing protein [Trichoderma breve]|uniref:Carboxylic ester hydrolase n=1 Tax=Trichoderma breve TaxID=2034170 RepID=A0A9W9E7P1_9HYPO|nr:carboxylesterase family domain-containing protein [Trichoderma breve]KAJ4859597.1 carboxylesterase family domain-containing protein [Trichoderma breve]